MSSDSPFLKYQDILINQSYSAAGALQDFALSCFNGSLGQFRGDCIRNFDDKHFAIFLELANYYRRHGANDEHLLAVGAAIWRDRRATGSRLLAELSAHQKIEPSEYPNGSESDYWGQMDWLQREVENMRQKGWIN